MDFEYCTQLIGESVVLSFFIGGIVGSVITFMMVNWTNKEK